MTIAPFPFNISPKFTCAEIRKAQLNDDDIGFILRCKEVSDEKPTWEEISRSSSTKAYWINWDLLHVNDGVLVRRWESNDGKIVNWKTVVPKTIRPVILEQLHSAKSASHLGVNKTLHKVQQNFYWVGLPADVRSWIRKCTVCAQVKTPPLRRREPLSSST